MIWTGSGWKSANMSPRDALKSGESQELPGNLCRVRVHTEEGSAFCSQELPGNLCRGGFSSWHNLQFVPSLRNYSKTEKKQQFLRQIENTSCQLASLRNSPRDLLADDDTNSILSDGVRIVGEVIVVIRERLTMRCTLRARRSPRDSARRLRSCMEGWMIIKE